LLALTAYLWLEIHDNIGDARNQATARAGAVGTAINRMTAAGSSPSASELEVARSLGVKAIQLIGPQGKVLATLGDMRGGDIDLPAAVENGRPVEVQGEDVRLSGNSFAPAKIGVLDLIDGGDYGGVYVFPAGVWEPQGAVRVVIAYDDLSSNAQTMLIRTLALVGGILAVAIVAMWLLMNRFVAQPLRQYSRMAMRIAAGEPLHMPDLAHNELGQLGQAINGMAAILRHEASVDAMTGLYNLRHLSARLEDFLAEAKANQQSLSLIVCDLDNLKPVNDGFGHQTGDLLLKAVARHLQVWAGIQHTCWRTGGDEFAAVMPNLDPDKAQEEAFALSRAIDEDHLVAPDGSEIRISLSIGIASYPADGLTGAALLKVADMRMYEAKTRKARAGREPTAA
jgi:diguanylate cyclase (GGDEF)-like protein